MMRKLETADFRDHYEKMTDEELVTLFSESSKLVDAARTALQAEISRRNLGKISLPEYGVEMERRLDADIRARGPVVEGDWAVVTVPRRRLRFPPVCPCCLVPDASTYIHMKSERETFRNYRVIYTRVQYLVLAVPHCKSCASRFKRWRVIWRASVVVGFSASLVIAVTLHLPSWVAGLLGILFFAAARVGPTYLKRAVRFLDYDDKWLDFRFRSLEYAREFYRLNSRP